MASSPVSSGHQTPPQRHSREDIKTTANGLVQIYPFCVTFTQTVARQMSRSTSARVALQLGVPVVPPKSWSWYQDGGDCCDRPNIPCHRELRPLVNTFLYDD